MRPTFARSVRVAALTALAAALLPTASAETPAPISVSVKDKRGDVQFHDGAWPDGRGSAEQWAESSDVPRGASNGPDENARSVLDVRLATLTYDRALSTYSLALVTGPGAWRPLPGDLSIFWGAVPAYAGEEGTESDPEFDSDPSPAEDRVDYFTVSLAPNRTPRIFFELTEVECADATGHASRGQKRNRFAITVPETCLPADLIGFTWRAGALLESSTGGGIGGDRARFAAMDLRIPEV